MRSNFIVDELWTLTVTASFQRANIYTKNASENDKNQLSSDLKSYVEELVKREYYSAVKEEQHLNNIQDLSNYSNKYANTLKNGKLNFGVSQKLLNLFLKYIWCLKMIPPPPHFPVDRVIQEKLNTLAIENGLKPRKVEPWTQFKDKTKYLEVIRFAESIRKKEKHYFDKPVAALELALYGRG